jgi:type VI protein secretion system component Hcp
VGAEEYDMNNVKINDLNSSNAVAAQEMESVKGGPAFMKLGDIKGDVSESSALPSEQLSLNYTKVTWTY